MSKLKHSAIALVMAASTSALAADPASAKSLESGSYKVDPMHSKVGFEVQHLVVSSVEGQFRIYDGTIVVDDNFAKSSVMAEADIASIDTGVKDRDDHLRSADFFDVSKNPKMIFKSTAIQGAPESFKLTGDLTIKGIKRKVTFDAKFLGRAKDLYGNDKAAFSAVTKINRKDFGLNWSKLVEVGPVVGDEVTIELKIQGAREKGRKVTGN